MFRKTILDELRDSSRGLSFDINNFNIAVNHSHIIVENFLTVELELSDTVAAILFNIEKTVRAVVRLH